VQRSISLDPEAENGMFKKTNEGLGDLKLTFRKFYRINGGATQLKGVTPDIVIPDRFEYIKIREKDNPDALKWDEVPQADYTPWNPGYDVKSVVASTNEQLKTIPTFSSISRDVKVLEDNSDKEYSLNLTQYRTDQAKLRTTVKNLETLSKLPADLIVTNSAADSLLIVSDKDKEAKNKQWLKRVGGDIYIDQTVKVLNTMIGQLELAKAK
jgi:carboxyl-terminal processing protease